jgi:hypothetical protein
VAVTQTKMLIAILLNPVRTLGMRLSLPAGRAAAEMFVDPSDAHP